MEEMVMNGIVSRIKYYFAILLAIVCMNYFSLVVSGEANEKGATKSTLSQDMESDVEEMLNNSLRDAKNVDIELSGSSLKTLDEYSTSSGSASELDIQEIIDIDLDDESEMVVIEYD